MRRSFPGTFLIELQRLEDGQGFFARTYDRTIFQEYGLVAEMPNAASPSMVGKAPSGDCITRLRPSVRASGALHARGYPRCDR